MRRKNILTMSDILDSHLGHPFREEDVRTGKGVTESVTEYVGDSTWYHWYGLHMAWYIVYGW